MCPRAARTDIRVIRGTIRPIHPIPLSHQLRFLRLTTAPAAHKQVHRRRRTASIATAAADAAAHAAKLINALSRFDYWAGRRTGDKPE